LSFKIVILGCKQGRIHGIKALRQAFSNGESLMGLKDAKDIWDRVLLKPTSVTPAFWGTDHWEVSTSLSLDEVTHVWGLFGSDPRLDPYECAACGDSRPYTWIDADLFLDPEHIEVFGGRLLCKSCWRSPLGELLPRIESRVRPPSRWDLLMNREDTCLT
jgi:hypothetical protein